MTVEAEVLRKTMRNWATGVTVVSSNHGGEQHGMTVNSFTSLALSPPLVMVSLEKGTRTHGLVQQERAFAVTILASDQREISDRFAGRESEQSDRFARLESFTLTSGCPLLVGGLAFFDCRVAATYSAGTHTIFIGEVLAAESNPDAKSLKPLLYYDQDYRQMSS